MQLLSDCWEWMSEVLLSDVNNFNMRMTSGVKIQNTLFSNVCIISVFISIYIISTNFEMMNVFVILFELLNIPCRFKNKFSLFLHERCNNRRDIKRAFRAFQD